MIRIRKAISAQLELILKYAPLNLTAKQSNFKYGTQQDKNVLEPLHLGKGWENYLIYVTLYGRS